MQHSGSHDLTSSPAIAIIGMAGRFPGAHNPQELWHNLINGVKSIQRFSDDELRQAGVDPELLRQPNYVKAGAPVENVDQFDAGFFGFTPREAEVMDPQQRLFLECSWQALEDAAYDPERTSALVGVFAGAAGSSYLQHNILTNPDLVELVGPLQIEVFNAPDALSSTISYRFNFRGPSVSIQSFCSTSLVAVHFAAQSLLNYECDMALAGGVAISVPHITGYLYQEGGIVSPDGECRSFDQSGQGSVMGNGVGVVILKRLEDALADGDHIYAAIRGSATNNDGTLRAGYTAPGLEGQSAVITEALSNAGIEAESLDYIEAHGTGTGLGDAIELAATIRALRKHTDKTGFVGIGSVKPNIGHLDRASGVTGLIKASLALKNRLLPPSLNFTQSSSDIDLAASPLYVNTELRPWETDGKPRRAGVSSFGVGGTNAHVVLEEAPALAPSSPGRSHQPLLLSAKTESALDAMTVNLARFLEANPDANLADVAYTLQVGRSAFNYRRAVVVGNRDEAIGLLGGDPAKLGVTNQVYRDRPVAFLFPGVGDHYVGMARELYQQEPSFRATVDRCCDLLQRQSSVNLAAALYPADSNSTPAPRAQTDLRALLRRDAPSGGDASALHRTELAQPAVFVIEYALTQLLISWGLKPQSMLGYSLGEYVAACVGGVLSLEDALRLVAARAQLIQQQPAGAMLAVAASEAAVQPFLGDGVCLAVVNSPTACVLAGPPAAIAAVAERLRAAEIANRPVETTHAFHSTMLAPIAAQVTALARSLTLNAPQIPYISNVTGTWITAEQAQDPAYWARHMTETVRFADGVGTLLQQADLAFVEVGPGQALASFVRQHPLCARERRASVVHTLRAQHEQQPDVAALMTTLGKLWQLGVTIDWSALSAEQTRYRLSLPTYPFERRRFWVEPGGARPVALTPSGKHPEIAQWFYQPVWEPAARPALSATAGRWLVFVDQHGVGDAAIARLTQAGQPVVQVRPGTEFAQIDAQSFQLRPGEAADYQSLVAALRGADLLPSHVLHLWPLESAESGDGIDRLAAAQGRGFYSLLFLTQALNSHLMTGSLQLTVLTNGMQQVADGEVPNADYAALPGLCTVIGQEYISVTCRSVDVLLPTDGDYAALAELALAETQAGSGDLLVAYRDGQRLAQRFTSSPLASSPSIVRPGGVYLITGGLGGVGLLLAEHLARSVQAKLVLLSRTGLPPRNEWSDWLETHSADNTTSDRIRKVQQLEALGGDVLVLPADVTDLAQMQAAIAEVRAQFGAINGVLHAAGISDPSSFGAIQRLVREQCEAHFQPKARGLYILEQALGDEPLDFCLLFSSLSAVLGGMGFAGYAAANSFMDVFAQRHNGKHAVKWLSVNWDAWRADESSSGKAGATLVQYEMLPAEGAQAFERVIAARGHTRIVNSTGDLHARIRQWVQLAALRSDDDDQPDAAQPVATRSRLSTSDYEQRLIAIWRYVLGIQEVELHDNFFDLGGNSLNGLQVIAQIKKEFKVQIPAVALFEAPTISALAQYLAPQEAPQVDRQETQLRDRRRKMREAGGAQDIAIISMVGRFPGANTVEQFWSNIRDGVESKTRFTDAELLAAGVEPELIQNPDYVKIRPVLDDVEHFDAAFFGYTPREAELMDPQQRLFHECAWEALELAGYDTQRYKGLIGVFAGTNLNFYMMRMAGDPALLAELNDNILLENDKDALATNVAYKLNLQGPSFAVQTFCSTSLVATHLACRSLLGGECDIALAGGVSVRVPVKAGYLYVEGDQVSPDGTCRTFDASGEGAIFGDGVAIVALKRLDDALADGDTIHAIIKGSAINNDGGRKVGYTAPSVTGQAEVVTTALERSGIDPTTIGYLEAHGTATRLGDPIEVASLTKAYRTFTERTNFCVIGSAKPNVGHLDRASGVTGLIKTAMMVQQGIIPPLLHFERPNPEIDFVNSPFVITTKRQEWPRGITPRRAAVNSLGVGGTNAHVIVEEPPSQAAHSPSRSYQLLLLSARTPAALDSATANLASFLRSNPETSLADVAHTLQVGRRGFEQRRMLVVRDAAEAVTLLDSTDSQRVVSRTQKPADRPVAFLFPGVGDHYIGMARDLYDHEPIFLAAVDRCCRLLQPLLSQDLKTLLYPATAPASSNGNGSATLDFRAMLGRGSMNGSSPLHRTDLAQPTVFVIEYALAQLLISWGIQPQAMIGYSLGEYVAATVAGVLSLDDALRLVATRAQLIQQQSAGAMLAVAASEADVQPFLGDGVCLAVVNSPTACVLAGPPEAIVAVSVRLQEAEIACRIVETTHAFHSTMLSPIAEQVTALAQSLKLNAPQIPYISNVTGIWITAEQAQDPAYWARHMTETVRFADGVGELLQRSDLAFVEVGPGQALGSFVRQHPSCSRERRATVVHTLRAQHEQQHDQAQLLQALGRLWLLDVPINWDGFYAQEQRRRIPLPTYPFERQRFWVEPRRLTSTAQAASGGRKADVADWFYLPEWIDTPLNAAAAPAKTWLIFADERGFSAQLAERIAQAGHKAVVVARGAQFAERGPNQFTVRPSSRDDYSALLDLLKTRKLFPEAIAHLWHAPDASAYTADGAGFAAALESGFYSLIALTKALSQHDLDTPITINVLSTGVQPALGDEPLVAEQSPLLAVCKVIAQENLSLKCRTIDVLAPTPDSADETALLSQIATELLSQSKDLTVAYRGERRLTQRFRPERLEPVTGVPARLRQNGVYLITGGLGGIGMSMAEYLARTVQAKLVLIGRSGLPERNTWADWIATHADDDATSRRMQRIQQLEALGAEVLVRSADVADEARMRAIVVETVERFGALHGIIHGAGNVNPDDFHVIEHITTAHCESQFPSKAYGLYILERIVEERAPDFCYLLSSISAVLGGLGYAAYTSANYFMDIFAHRANRRGRTQWLATNWDTWRFVEADTPGVTLGEYEMFASQGVDAFARVLERGATQIVTSIGDLDVRIRQWVLLESLQEQPGDGASSLATHARPSLDTPYVAPNNDYERRIAAIWQQVLGLEQVGLHDNFFDLGGNSLISLQVIAKLKKEFKTQVPAVAMFEAPTVSALAQYLAPQEAPQVDRQETQLRERRQKMRETGGSRDIAIVGMAGRFPGASTVEQFWQNLSNGVESLTFFSDEELIEAGVDPLVVQNPAYVKSRHVLDNVEDFDAAFFGYTPREAELMDPQQRLFHECAWEAIEMAGYDTLRYKGLVGVFAGANISLYLMRLATDPSFSVITNESAIFENAQDGLTTNVSYRLNLRGPSFAVQTFCSTSLVATHLACRSLLNGESDMALAGGVSVRVPVKMGHLYREGGQESPDGHCRTFDADAQGAVWADGVAVVLLKRLDDALADGDTIHAVIKGSAINNDGNMKVGYTAPSVVGQSTAIMAALEQSQIDPATIGYLEAHGSATPLGDPIEVASLTKAYRTFTDRTNFCVIGSTKPNVGHLDRASGVAGLIKTTMILKHGQIPPLLHFQRPNPEIDFAGSPFVITTQRREWQRGATPRRAAVNSLGVGGTNAHVVLEEALNQPPSSPSRPYQLLLLSAKTETALDSISANLASFLRSQPETSLADVAHTLQIGRRGFEQRRMLVVRDAADAVALLDGGESPRVVNRTQKPADRPVAFLFPGVGDHYVGMARDLYDHEPIFQAAVDRCCRLLNTLLEQDLRTLLYPATTPTSNGNGSATLDFRAMLGRGNGSSAPSPLHRTDLAQPTVFVIEYALAQLLIAWGIQPKAMIGYSLGEYVAACVAGVLSLDDALRLVATRAQLIQQQPAGAMLAVGASEIAVEPFLGNGVCLAVVNSPTACVLAGPPTAIAAVAERLDAADIANRPVETTHAFHSTMLAPIAEQVTALARSLTLNAPQIPYISNVTGTWITAEQATDPAYWARHMTETVRFADGVGTLLHDEALAFLEVGPGQALGSFVRQHPLCDRDRRATVVHTLRARHEQQQDQAQLLQALGRLWLLDVPINWGGFYTHEERRRIPLPTYPFERQRFWAEPKRRPGSATNSPPRRNDVGEWFTTPSWKRSNPGDGSPVTELDERHAWLIFLDSCGVGTPLVRQLTGQGQDVITVTPGASFARYSPTGFTVRPREREDYEALLRELNREQKLPDRIVHLWSVTPPPDGADETEAGLANLLDHGFYSLFTLAQALGDQGIDRCQISVISNDMQEVTGVEQIVPAKAAVIGPCKVIPQEYRGISCRSIDVQLPPSGPSAQLIDQLLDELSRPVTDDLVALRGAHRWVQTLEPVPLQSPTRNTRLRENGVYLITGGLGGIGLAMAEHLADACHAKLVLVGRTALPPRAQWPAILASADTESGIGRRIKIVQELEARTEVLVLQADVADAVQIQIAVDQAVARFGTIHGVLHAAGLPGVGLTQLKSAEAAAGVLAPKVHGTLALVQALRGLSLDFLALFSSIASVTSGGPGQIDYCAASAFMEHYAQRHSGEHGATIAVSWGEWLWDAWQEGLQGYPEDVRAFLIANRRAYGIAFHEGTEAFRRVLAGRLPHVYITTQDLVAMVDQIRNGLIDQLLGHGEGEADDRPLYPRPVLSTSFIEPRNELEAKIAAIWGSVLGIADIGINDNFFDLGGNSLVGVEVISKIRRALSIDKLPAYMLYDAPSVAEMAAYVAGQGQAEAVEPEEDLEDRGERRKAQLGILQRRSFVEEVEEEEIV
ncbi:MAG: SDR family oxidoreductase [Chloroflexi bacterium]|nr:SDR family oxidoreductase [Chloroflexota bacterium]